MLIIEVQETESIDKALKRFKKKFERTGMLKQLRARVSYEKPSIRRRNAKSRTLYKQKKILQQI